MWNFSHRFALDVVKLPFMPLNLVRCPTFVFKISMVLVCLYGVSVHGNGVVISIEDDIFPTTRDRQRHTKSSKKVFLAPFRCHRPSLGTPGGRPVAAAWGLGCAQCDVFLVIDDFTLSLSGLLILKMLGAISLPKELKWDRRYPALIVRVSSCAYCAMWFCCCT